MQACYKPEIEVATNAALKRTISKRDGRKTTNVIDLVIVSTNSNTQGEYRASLTCFSKLITISKHSKRRYFRFPAVIGLRLATFTQAI